MIKPKVKLITIKEFAEMESVNVKTAWNWLAKASVEPYKIGSFKRKNKHTEWSCQIIALDESMVKAMKEMRAK